MKKSKHTPLDKLKHHVTGAIERGEKKPIEAIVSKHTPGPWIVAENDSCCVLAKGKHIVTAHDTDGGRSETGRGSRNAQLIAAAPEMLEALEIALRELKRINNPKGPDLKSHEPMCVSQLAIGLCEEAIKKARGEK